MVGQGWRRGGLVLHISLLVMNRLSKTESAFSFLWCISGFQRSLLFRTSQRTFTVYGYFIFYHYKTLEISTRKTRKRINVHMLRKPTFKAHTLKRNKTLQFSNGKYMGKIRILCFHYYQPPKQRRCKSKKVHWLMHYQEWVKYLVI